MLDPCKIREMVEDGLSGFSDKRAELVNKYLNGREVAVAKALSVVPTADDDGEYLSVNGAGASVTIWHEDEDTWTVLGEDGRESYSYDSREKAIESAKEELETLVEQAALADASREYETNPEQTMYEMSLLLELPEGWSVRDTAISESSFYWMLVSKNGEYYKVRVSDHAPSVFREKEFGGNDGVFYAKPLEPENFGAAMDRVEDWLKKLAAAETTEIC